MRKILSLTLICTLILSSWSFSVYAEEKDFFENSIILLVDSPKCYVNGKLQSVGDVVPTIVNDRTLVPVRFLTESFGGEVEWDPASKTATLAYGDDIIDIPVGQNKLVVNGVEKGLDVGGEIIGNRTMLPVRAISEALGKNVGYNSGIISLTDNDVEKYDENSPYSKQTMDAIRKKLTLERDGKTIAVPTEFAFDAMMNSSGVLTFSENDLPYVSKTDSYAVCGNIFIENLNIKPYSDTERKMTFDAYNYDYVYGIVEVYDENDNLKSHRMIEPFGGMWTSLAEYGVAAWNMGVSVSQWVKTGDVSYFTYRNQTQTKHTYVDVLVPKNGYVLVTANPSVSPRLCAYDVSKTVTKTISLALLSMDAVKDAVKDKNSVLAVTDILEGEISGILTDEIANNPKLYSEIIMLLSGEGNTIATDKNVKELAKKLINVLSDNNPDFLKKVGETVGGLLVGTGEGLLTEAASLFVYGGIGVALDAMSFINSGSDLVCLFYDLQFSVSKGNLVLKLTTDELKVYQGVAKLAGKTVAGTSDGIVYTNSAGEKTTLAYGDYLYRTFVTDGYDVYYYNKNDLAIYHSNIANGTNEKIANVFGYFNTYFRPQDGWSVEECFNGGRIEGYHNGKIYFEECGGFESFPMATIDIKTGEYRLTPLKNIGRLGFYKDKMYYMIQTGSFDLFPMYIANTDGTGSYTFRNDVWRFEIRDNILYICSGISTSYNDYNKGNVSAINLDDGTEVPVAEKINASSDFESVVAEYHRADK